MAKIKFETIKNKIKRHVIYHIDSSAFDLSDDGVRLFLSNSNTGEKFYQSKEEAKKMVTGIIDNWDVRNVKGLVTAFPDVYPRLTNKILALSINEKGEWVVHSYCHSRLFT
jgi:hypothetical protein